MPPGAGGRGLRRRGQPCLAIGAEGVEEVRQSRNNVLVIIGAALLLAGLLLYALASPDWLIGAFAIGGVRHLVGPQGVAGPQARQVASSYLSISFVFVAVRGGVGISCVACSWRFLHGLVVFIDPLFCFFLGVSAGFGTALWRQFILQSVGKNYSSQIAELAYSVFYSAFKLC